MHRDGGPIDVLVNNAGLVFGGAFLDVPLERHLTTYRVNTLGLVAMTHAFLPDLMAGRDGHVVNVASASGFIGLPFGATYASSKWAVLGFSELLERAHAGEEVVIAKAGKPYARLVPIVAGGERKPGAFRGRIRGDVSGPLGSDDAAWG